MLVQGGARARRLASERPALASGGAFVRDPRARHFRKRAGNPFECDEPEVPCLRTCDKAANGAWKRGFVPIVGHWTVYRVSMKRDVEGYPKPGRHPGSLQTS
jgi:hypothetical protein